MNTSSVEYPPIVDGRGPFSLKDGPSMFSHSKLDRDGHSPAPLSPLAADSPITTTRRGTDDNEEKRGATPEAGEMGDADTQGHFSFREGMAFMSRRGKDDRSTRPPTSLRDPFADTSASNLLRKSSSDLGTIDELERKRRSSHQKLPASTTASRHTSSSTSDRKVDSPDAPSRKDSVESKGEPSQPEGRTGGSSSDGVHSHQEPQRRRESDPELQRRRESDNELQQRRESDNELQQRRESNNELQQNELQRRSDSDHDRPLAIVPGLVVPAAADISEISCSIEVDSRLRSDSDSHSGASHGSVDEHEV